MDKDELIQELAKVLSGLQVPMSLGGASMLGTAYDPVIKIRDIKEFPWGWATADEIAAFLTARLS